MSLKKITIITPSFNRGQLLDHAIQTVIRQNYPHYEQIVIDGGSTDDTQAVVSRYDHIRFVSGADQGMYDALNKGLALASGEVIGFLNTDDLYAENIFGDVMKEFERHPGSAVAGRATVFMEKDNGVFEVVGRYSPKNKSLLEDSTIGSNYFNAWFFHRSVFEKVGNFDITYRVAGDRDFMLRFCLSGLEYSMIDTLIYQYRHHSGSLTFDPADDKREVVAHEHLKMTDFYLRQKLPTAARRLLNQLRTREALELSRRSIQSGKYLSVPGHVWESVRYDPAWLAKWFWEQIRNVIGWPIRVTRRLYKRMSNLKTK